jgi:hypothetical protein
MPHEAVNISMCVLATVFFYLTFYFREMYFSVALGEKKETHTTPSPPTHTQKTKREGHVLPYSTR